MIDEAAWTKFGNGQEPGTGYVFVISTCTTATRHKGRQWQAREVVPRQKTLAGKVTVRVEVGLELGIALQQKFDLCLRLGPESPCLIAILLRPAGVADDEVLGVPLFHSSVVQTAPAFARILELPFNFGHGFVKPRRPVPAATLKFMGDAVENMFHSYFSSSFSRLIGQMRNYAVQKGQCGLVTVDIQQITE